MILQHLNSLRSKNIILASASPRRREILEKIGLKLTIMPSEFEENLDPNSFSDPGDFVISTAHHKADEVAKRLDRLGSPPDLVIGADTCVSLSGKVYGKPKDHDDAFHMLSKLSGKGHEVLTGVCLMVRKGRTWQDVSFSETTSVQFAELNAEIINAYIDTGEPFDKAGGYGIQGFGGTLVEAINGDYYNVMGFPLHRFCLHLAKVMDELVP
nr:dTTP/UTP pyrophosphatase-like [Procambarus clarkii]